MGSTVLESVRLWDWSVVLRNRGLKEQGRRIWRRSLERGLGGGWRGEQGTQQGCWKLRESRRDGVSTCHG